MVKINLVISKIANIFKKRSKPLELPQEASSIIQQERLRKVNRPSSNDLRSFIKRWNSMYPIDRWWREKYKVALNSEQHRNTAIIDMRLEWEEDLLYQQMREDVLVKKSNKYIPGRGEWLKKREINEKPTEDQVNEMFDNFDVSTIKQGDDQKEIII